MPKPDGYENDLQYIKDYLLPQWLILFTKKNADYQGDSGDLGTAGGFVDIWRKAKKLKKALWDKQELIGEQPIEITNDLIGHAFLLLIDLIGEQEEAQTMGKDLPPSVRRELGVDEG